MSRIIVLATPVFLLAIGLEWWWARRQGRALFHWPDAITSIHLGMLSQLVGVLTPVFTIGIYAAVLQAWGPSDVAFWHSAGGHLLALVLYDFCYYWFHRLSHERSVLWAAHVVHHSSRDYNLSTALRQTSTGFALGWVFYLPLAGLGVPVQVFATVALIDLLYQFWVHTQLVGSLGWFDRWFCAPSNHRVHHATNPIYLDKNYGGILLVWDHWFGTYQAEDPHHACVYGTVAPLASIDPLWANLSVYAQLWRDLRQTPRWSDKVRVLIGPTGWHPPGVSAAAPRRYTADWGRLSGRDQVLAGLGFAAALVAVATVLWMAPVWPVSWQWAGLVGVGIWLWWMAHWLQRAAHTA